MLPIRTLRNVLLACAFASTDFPGVPLQAQIHHDVVEAQVPFAFEAGKIHLEAGSYTLTLPGSFMLAFHGKQHFALAMVNWDTASRKHDIAKAVFHRYGSRYFLHEICLGDGKGSVVLPESKEERRARQQQIVSQLQALTQIEVALLEVPPSPAGR